MFFLGLGDAWTFQQDPQTKSWKLNNSGKFMASFKQESSYCKYIFMVALHKNQQDLGRTTSSNIKFRRRKKEIQYAGCDFYGHPGILDDMKSSNLTGNLCLNHRTLIRWNEFACCYMKFPVTESIFLLLHKFPITRRIRNIFCISKKENSCRTKNIHVTWNICHRNKLPLIVMNFQ